MSDNALNASHLYSFAQDTIAQLGREALKFYGKGSHRPPFDRELVTQAELHLTGRFQELISGQFPDHQAYGQSHLDDGYTHGNKRCWPIRHIVPD